MNALNPTKIDNPTSPQEAILQMAKGFEISQCIFAVTQLGIADLLKEGPKHCDDLAVMTHTHSDSLYRLLRTLSILGVFSEVQPKYFQLTPLSVCLQDNEPGSLRNVVLLRAKRDYISWGNVIHSLRTGKSAFDYEHGITWYQHLKQNPDLANVFDRAMVELSALHNATIITTYDFSLINQLVDVGGGEGSFLATVLQQYSTLRGILLDQSYAVEKANTLLEEANVINRCELVAGNFFESVPNGANLYFLKNILHNWDDQKAIQILRNCYRAMAKEGRLLAAERILTADIKSNLMDLNLLVVLSAGRLRTEAEFRKLFESAGFKLTQIIPTEVGVSLIEGVRDSEKRF